MRTAILGVAAVLLAGVLAQPAHAEVSFDVAYTNLSEHGTWLVSAQFGHVWQPREYTRDWNPYYDGHWVYTDMGWAWVSDYEWGSIPYHYGTWYSDPDSGWVWVPGRVWASSWVVFRTGPDYIGWAPVPPGFSIGLSSSMGGPSSFVFVSSHDFLAPRVRMSVIPRARESVSMSNTTTVNNIVVQNNIVINQGPDYRTVEKAIGRPIRTERIETVARVAPYAHVERAQLALAPGTAQQDVRVVQPVPASEPLPVSNSQGHRGANAPTAAAPAPSGVQSANEQHPPLQTQGAPAPLPPGTTNAQQSAQAEADAKARAQQSAQEQTNAKTRSDHSAKAQATAETKADQSAQSQADAKAKADQSVQAQADAKAKADQSAQSQANARAHSDQNAQAQANAKAKADQNAHSQAAAKAHADQNAQAQANEKAKADQNAQSQATARAHADQNAQAQANAKAHADQNAQAQAAAKAKADQVAQANANAKKAADAKAKKHPPETPPAKDPNSTEGTPPADKNDKPPR